MRQALAGGNIRFAYRAPRTRVFARHAFNKPHNYNQTFSPAAQRPAPSALI